MSVKTLATLHKRLEPLAGDTQDAALRTPAAQEPFRRPARAVEGALGSTRACRGDHLSRLDRRAALAPHRLRQAAAGQTRTRGPAGGALVGPDLTHVVNGIETSADQGPHCRTFDDGSTAEHAINSIDAGRIALLRLRRARATGRHFQRGKPLMTNMGARPQPSANPEIEQMV